jgi:hypothetical protein
MKTVTRTLKSACTDAPPLGGLDPDGELEPEPAGFTPIKNLHVPYRRITCGDHLRQPFETWFIRLGLGFTPFQAG